MTNESAILGLLADLYKRATALEAENAQLRAELARHADTADDPS